MSGFLAIVHAGGAPVDGALLGRMTDAMAYCGPDHRETWTEGSVGLGHALLASAPDPPDGEHLPCSLDARLWIAADARIDGREELVRELAARGREVGTDTTDAQLILHAYHAWGERCVEHLIGDFAFAIWDAAKRRLFCARDQFGVVPLYYARAAEGVAISNVLNCLRHHPSVSDTLDERAIGDFLLFQCNRDVTRTSFADIHAVPPAHVLTAEDGVPQIRRYWELARPEEIQRERPQEYVERFTAVFDRAVADRLRSNRVGTQLSGGMDSTSIAVTAQRALESRGEAFDLRAYTIVYDKLIAEEEGRYADEVAAAMNVPVEHLVADEYVMRAPEGEVDWVYPEPCVIPNQLAEYEIAMRVSSFARGLFVGFGGDPLFWVDSRLRRPGARAAVRRLRARWRRPPGVPDWIDPDFARRVDLTARWRELHERWRAKSGLGGMMDPFWVALFSWAHPGANGTALRTLFPFFDLRLVEVVSQTTPSPWRQDKRLLREAMRGRLPEAVRGRPKTPLYVPTRKQDTANPEYRKAMMPSTKRWRAELLSTSPIGNYVRVERALAAIESPVPDKTLPEFRNCFPLAHWLRSPRGARMLTSKETPHAAKPAPA